MVQQANRSDGPGATRARSSTRDAAKADLVVVANRLPVKHTLNQGEEEWRPSPGGLVSALTAVLPALPYLKRVVVVGQAEGFQSLTEF